MIAYIKKSIYKLEEGGRCKKKHSTFSFSTSGKILAGQDCPKKFDDHRHVQINTRIPISEMQKEENGLKKRTEEKLKNAKLSEM